MAAGEGAEEPMSLTDMIVWTVRVVLPIILFWVWFRTQPTASSGGKNRHQKLTLLAMRDAMGVDDEPPEELRSLRLAEEAKVREALGIPEKRGGKGGGKRGDKGQRSPGGGGKGDRGNFGDRDVGCGTPSAAALAAAEKAAAERLDDEERLSLEALAKFVAIRDESRPQRVFLPKQGQRPPAPPCKPAAGAEGSKVLPELDPGEALKMNADMQKVLKGATLQKVGLKCAEVAKVVGEKLADAQVRPSEQTFALLVETCVNTKDLKSASDFLMKMESSGFCADPELLDKVMDLYSQARGTGSTPTSSPSVGLGSKDQGLGFPRSSDSGPAHAAPKSASALPDFSFCGSGASGSAGFGATNGSGGGSKMPGLDSGIDLLGSPGGGGGGPGWGGAWSDDEDGDGLRD